MPTKSGKSSDGVKRVSRSPKKRAKKKIPKTIDEASLEEAASLDLSVDPEVAPPKKSILFRSIGKTKVRKDEVFTFLRQLIMMLDAGTPLMRSLQTLAQRGESEGIRSLVGDIARYVEEGNALWQAFERHSELFDRVFVNLIKASEASGTLVTVLRRQVEHWERQDLLQKKYKRAMYYPIVLVVISVAVFFLLSWLFIPQMEAMYKQIGGEVPWYTETFIGIIKTITNPLVLLAAIIVLAVLIMLYKVWVRNPLNRLVVDRIALRIPKFGPGVIAKFAIVEFTRSMALLLRSGLSMMVTLDLVRVSVHNQALAQVLLNLRDSVERGEGIEEPLRQANKVVPPVVTDMLVTGEESGQLDEIAEHVANTYDQEVQFALDGLGEMMTPILTVLVGGVVLVAALALFVPLIGMIQQISGGGL